MLQGSDPSSLATFARALLLQAGYNATLVAFGAMAFGFAAALAGSYLVLRRRAMVADAIGHATLPGVGIAFLILIATGGSGRELAGLMSGSAVSAALGLFCLDFLTRHTRLSEDAAIGAVLSVFFGLGVVILTVVQNIPSGQQAGLEHYLLGSTAGMLQSEALTIAGGAVATVIAVIMLHRWFIAIAFDQEYSRAHGIRIAALDFLLLAITLGVVTIGLKVVGLIMVVAALVIPPVTARMWTDRAGVMVIISGIFGGVAAHAGVSLSAAWPALPTGPVIVLVLFSLFTISFLLAPGCGLFAGLYEQRKERRALRRLQGLITLAKGRAVKDAATLRLLRHEGMIDGNGHPIAAAGRHAAHAALNLERQGTALEIPGISDALARMGDLSALLPSARSAEIDTQPDGLSASPLPGAPS